MYVCADTLHRESELIFALNRAATMGAPSCAYSACSHQELALCATSPSCLYKGVICRYTTFLVANPKQLFIIYIGISYIISFWVLKLSDIHATSICNLILANPKQVVYGRITSLLLPTVLCFPQQCSFPNVTEQYLRSDSLELLNRPHTCWKYFLTHESLSRSTENFPSNMVSSCSRSKWIFQHSLLFINYPLIVSGLI